MNIPYGHEQTLKKIPQKALRSNMIDQEIWKFGV